MRALAYGAVASALLFGFALIPVSAAQDISVPQDPAKDKYPVPLVLIVPPLLFGVWIDWEGLPEARVENPALRAELDRGDVTVDPAGSFDARRLCMNDELGYSYTRRDKMHIGVCPSAVNMTTEISSVMRLIAYEQAAGTPSAVMEALVADWSKAIGQNIVDANRDVVVGKYTQRCLSLYRYYLWKSDRLMPSSCEDFVDEAHMQAYSAWFKLVKMSPREEERHWPVNLQNQLKGIVQDRRALITFIVLHELGHHRLQHHAIRGPASEQELEADKFAFERMSAPDVFAVAFCFHYLVALNPKNELARNRLVTIGDTMLTVFSLERLRRSSIQERRKLMQEIGAPESDGDRPESARRRIIEVHERFVTSVK